MIKPTIAIIATALALTACATSSNSPWGVVWVPASAERIRFSGAENAQMLHIRYRDSWQMEEYASFQNAGRQAEIIYTATDERVTAALEHNLTLDRATRTWNFNTDQALAWGEKGEAFAHVFEKCTVFFLALFERLF